MGSPRATASEIFSRGKGRCSFFKIGKPYIAGKPLFSLGIRSRNILKGRLIQFVNPLVSAIPLCESYPRF